MAFSTQEAVSDGTLQYLDLSIMYTYQTEISVYIDGVVTAAWSFVGDAARIAFDSPVPDGSVVLVVRTTDTSGLRHEYSKGAAFTARTLDESFRQTLQIAQEAIERGVTQDFYANISMHGHRITNLGAGTLPTDAATVGQLTAITQAGNLLHVHETKAAADAEAVGLPDGVPFYVRGLGWYYTQGGLLVLREANPVPAKKNYLWSGAMQYWPMGRTRSVLTTGRLQIPAGVTHAREGLAAGTNVIHAGRATLRVHRPQGTVSAAAHTVTFSLTQVESEPLVGRKVRLHGSLRKGPGYTGGSGITYTVQYSNEPEQPILRADGAYTNGNRVAAAFGEVPGVLEIPECTQVSVVVRIPWSGTAPDEDWVELIECGFTLGDEPATLLPIPFEEAEVFGRTRYQTSYPYGVPRGSNTEQGAVSAIVSNNGVNWGAVANVQFAPTMAHPPQVIFQSPLSGTESRWTNKTAQPNVAVNGLAFNVSEHGVTLTNNAILTPGDRLLCQWTAEVLF